MPGWRTCCRPICMRSLRPVSVGSCCVSSTLSREPPTICFVSWHSSWRLRSTPWAILWLSRTTSELGCISRPQEPSLCTPRLRRWPQRLSRCLLHPIQRRNGRRNLSARCPAWSQRCRCKAVQLARWVLDPCRPSKTAGGGCCPRLPMHCCFSLGRILARLLCSFRAHHGEQPTSGWWMVPWRPCIWSVVVSAITFSVLPTTACGSSSLRCASRWTGGIFRFWA
mmetsp:Transcript_40448/g.97020  ORF Transcript_40448/g.97020 Transcript_40448/m.97020 type:complete len:224 (+) Transcript_40448:289-960(+)